jgi:hypothetical protein
MSDTVKDYLVHLHIHTQVIGYISKNILGN